MVATQIDDSVLWERVQDNDTAAFERVVAKHQSAVSAVSYSCVGEFASSEDISQETFLVAWQTKSKLKNAAKLRAWLCGIARNLSQNHVRRNARRKEHAANLAQELQGNAAASHEDVESRAMDAEEQALVWRTLESIAESYREPLVLFYREGRSVASIAEALDISEDTAKQRLSRGRGMLRESVAKLIGETLEQTRPGQNFTAGVMAAIGTIGMAGKGTAATAGLSAATAIKSTVGAAKIAGSAGAIGVAGGLLGAAGGLAGGWFGSWLPAQLAPTVTERELLEARGKRSFREGVVFTIVICLCAGLGNAFDSFLYALPIVLVATLIFMFSTIISTRKTHKAIAAMRATYDGTEAPNDSPLRQFADRNRLRWKGRQYRSRANLLGLPLVDIQVSDPPAYDAMMGHSQPAKQLEARGWIAIGDRARARLIAVGGTAIAPIALGGRAFGVVAVGGLALGVVAIGGGAFGVLGIGGLAIGLLAVGGLGIGWEAVGGGAAAWHFAAGGGAVAKTAALGGGAWAGEITLGASELAQVGENEVAKDFIANTMTMHVFEFLQTYALWMIPVGLLAIALIVLPPFAMYKRVGVGDSKQSRTPTT